MEIVRALHKVLRALDEIDAKQEVTAGNAGKPWTAEDDADLDSCHLIILLIK